MDNPCGCCCCCGLYFTGGSIANTSRRIEKNSTRVALCFCQLCIHLKNQGTGHSHPKPPSNAQDSDDTPFPPT